MLRIALYATLLAGCSFDAGGGDLRRDGGTTPDAGAEVDAGGAADGAPADGSTPDAGPACEPSSLFCSADGRTLETCADDGSGPDPALAVPCDLACAGAECFTASNLPAHAFKCDASAPTLAPPAGASVVFSSPNQIPTLTCTPHCGGAITGMLGERLAQGTDLPDLAWFCLSQIDLPPTASVFALPEVDFAIALFADGAVTIAGGISIDAGFTLTSPAPADATRLAGPGGHDGADRANAQGSPGAGPCPGGGGLRAGGPNDRAGGGGGGGGFAGRGGDGGSGQRPNGGSASGGPGGDGGCGEVELIPLEGGSGGGSGGGASGSDCGDAGGGGGGALQVTSRVSITVSGALSAAGGGGVPDVPNDCDALGGGGGGGSGGAFLLEAPVIAVTGSIGVEGGPGSASGAGAGGAGAAGDNLDGQNGASAGNAGAGGAGGGGGGGRVRLNALEGPDCDLLALSPEVGCTTGSLRAQP